MSNRITSIAFVLVMTLSWTLPQRAAPDSTFPYPNGYRKWVHVGTTLVGPQSPFFAGNGGIHHIYANEKAVKGYESGTFPTDQSSCLTFSTRKKLTAPRVRDRVSALM
jgi:hypothetical protein